MTSQKTPQEFADNFLQTMIIDRVASLEALEIVAHRGKSIGAFTATQLLEACALIRQRLKE